MDRIKIFLIFAMISTLFFSCKNKTNPSSVVTPPSPTINKSFKRGIAFSMVSPNDFVALSKGVSWWYNWSTNYDPRVQSNYYQAYNMDFVPMLWGGNTSNSDISAVENLILAHSEIKYLLVMNEPNLINQADRTPQEAAVDWLKYEKVVSDLAAKGRTIYIVGPAMTWGTMTNYSDPIVWLDSFYVAYKTANNGKLPEIDYLAFHWYDYGLSSQLDRLDKYNKKIWVTEMANWNSQINSYSMQEVQMTDMVNTCETRSDVFRYACFYGRGNFPDNHFTYLFTPNDGELSVLGKLYISLPY